MLTITSTKKNMELLKSNPVIDPKYKPSMEMGYMDYFNRAIAFAQTNYQDQLAKLSRTHFIKLSPTNFFEEYAWSVSCVNENLHEVSRFFPELSKRLSPFYTCFWDLNNFPNIEEIKPQLISLNNSEKKTEALITCADIINRGIKLFGWDNYKDNFLSTPEKLCVLPVIGMSGAKQLCRNIGISSEVLSTAKLHQLAVHWGFEDSKLLCAAIQQHVNMQLKVIELVMWYASATFETTIPST